jgi:hypothetical protein
MSTGQYNTGTVLMRDGASGEVQLNSRGQQLVQLKSNASDILGGAPNPGASVTGGAALDTRSFDMVSNGAAFDPVIKGTTTHRLLSAAASTNATSVKVSAGNVHKVYGVSGNAAARYLKFYNKATAPTVGTDTPIFTFYIPPNTVNGGQFSFDFGAQPHYFSTGIAYAMTTAAADADTGALTAGDVIAFNISYS